MGVTSFGRHTCPGCNLGHSRDLFFVLNDVDLHIVCVFLWTSGDARGLEPRLSVYACAVGLGGYRLL